MDAYTQEIIVYVLVGLAVASIAWSWLKPNKKACGSCGNCGTPKVDDIAEAKRTPLKVL